MTPAPAEGLASQREKGDDRSRLARVLLTDALANRGSRAPDHAAEAAALAALAEVLSTNPREVLQHVVDIALTLCRADSAGVSVFEPGDGQDIVRWYATAGALASHAQRTMPRPTSPCSEATGDAALLLDRPGRYFRALDDVHLPVHAVHEKLVVPWTVNGVGTGTLWVIGHTAERHFDQEDARLLATLARFAAAGWHTVRSLDDQAALAAHEERARLALQASARFGWEIDLTTQLVTYSGDQRAVLGFELPASLDDRWALVHPDDREAGQEEYRRALETETPFVGA